MGLSWKFLHGLSTLQFPLYVCLCRRDRTIVFGVVRGGRKVHLDCIVFGYRPHFISTGRRGRSLVMSRGRVLGPLLDEETLLATYINLGVCVSGFG